MRYSIIYSQNPHFLSVSVRRYSRVNWMIKFKKGKVSKLFALGVIYLQCEDALKFLTSYVKIEYIKN